nr:DNA-binding protein [Azospirillum argentinense]
MTSAQFRMARAALDWTVRELAAKAGVHRNTIARIEAGEASHGPTLAAVQRALEDAGIIFLSAGEQRIGGPGVRLREPEET